MINAPHGKEFIFRDGTKAKNILELVSVIESLTDHDFHHFVNAHKNDFANWADHVLVNKVLSEKLRAVSTKSDTIRIIKEEISDSASRGKIGGSIMNIFKLEDHSRHGQDAHANEGKGKNAEDHAAKMHAESTFVKDDAKEEREEKKTELKASRNWFKLFSRKKLSEKNIETLEHKEEEKFHVEREVKEELKNDGRENALWVALYIALVVLIVTLLVYKLFL